MEWPVTTQIIWITIKNRPISNLQASLPEEGKKVQSCRYSPRAYNGSGELKPLQIFRMGANVKTFLSVDLNIKHEN